MSTFLVSWLSKKYGALDASIFLREQPGEWLVLEGAPGEASRGSESIAARLALRSGRSRYTLGRDPGSDFIVAAPGVALSHVVLQLEDDGVWTIRRASDDTPAKLDGLELGDFAVPLGSGARIELGGLQITYLDGGAFHSRLAQAA